MEVRIVVVIIGILAALAYPNLQNCLMRARQTEAKTNQRHIHRLEDLLFDPGAVRI